MKKVAILTLMAITLTGCATKTVPLTAGDAVLDTEFFNQATSTGNIGRCEEIVDETLKTECKALVNASVDTEKAVENNNLRACNTIEVERYRTNCTNRVNENIKYAKADENRLSAENEAVDSGNIAPCNNIENEPQKESCIFNVLAKKAVDANDPTICDAIGDEEGIVKCKSAIE